MDNALSGTLYKKNGYYYARVYYYFDGKRKTKDKATKIAVDGGSSRKTAKNERDANRFLTDFLREFIPPGTIILAPITEQMIADTANAWLAHLGSSLAPGTLSNYTYIVRDITLYFTDISPVRTVDLTSAHVESYLNWERMRRQPGYTGDHKVRSQRSDGSGIENTVKHRHTALRSILQYAKREGIITRNVASLRDCQVSVPKPQRQEFPVLTEKEALVLINALENEPLWFRIAVLLGLLYGLRRSEIVGLRSADIDWDNNLLTVVRTVTQQTLDHKNTITVKPFTKNRQPKTFVVSGQLQSLLQSLVNEHRKNALQFGSTYDKTWADHLIRYEDGTLVSPNTLTSYFKKFLKRNQLKEIRLHDLRHSCASILYANGTDLMTIQEVLGHAQLTTTIMYTHKLSDRKTVALTQMHDQFLLPTVEEQEESEK